jgi:hypothetical protein
MTTQATPPRPRDGPEEFSGRLTTEEEARTLFFNRVSWGAVLAGVMVALVTQLILNLIGIGIGAASFDPASGDNPSGSTFSIAAGIWWALSGILAALAGGYTASRLSGQPTDTSGPWHGLTVWAVTTLLVFYLLSTSIGAIVGGAFRTMGSVAGGATQALGATAKTTAQMVVPAIAGSSDPFSSIDQSIRSASGGTDPAALRDAATAAVRAAVVSDPGEREAARDRAAQALAKAQNISVEQARTQIGQYEQQYRQAVDEAKRQATAAAEVTRTAVSRGALFGAVALLLGALAAWFGGRMGALSPAELSAAMRRRRLN